MKKTVIFVASSGRNVGKTSISIGLIHYFLKTGKKVAFVKPVAQHYEEIDGHKISRDVLLMSKIYNFIVAEKLFLASPFVIESGFTRKFIKGEVKTPKDLIKKYFDSLLSEYDVLIVEGTGHPGVGSCIGLSNAEVAKILEATTLLVLEGGIGNTIDNYTLAKGVFRSANWAIEGVIINKVHSDKYEEIDSTLRKFFRNEDVYYLGTIPFVKELSVPSLHLIADTLKAEVIQREDLLSCKATNIMLGINEPHIFLDELENTQEDTVIITPGDREDILMSILALYERLSQKIKAVILTSTRPHERILKLFETKDIPVLYTTNSLFKTASIISSITVKIDPYEKEKIATLQNLFEKYIDLSQLKKFTNLATKRIERKSTNKFKDFIRFLLSFGKK
ncbi:MAG: phosphotransacetylase family protein [Candidatus Hydrothermia bacterium]